MINIKMFGAAFMAFLATPFVSIAKALVDLGCMLQESAKEDAERNGQDIGF